MILLSHTGLMLIILSWVIDRISETCADGDTFKLRCNLLLPLYRLKWCAIMLNEFLPSERRRRDFARGEKCERKKQEQLIKTKEYFRKYLQNN